MDQGGELYQNPAIWQLFKQHGYELKPTGADASNQNGPIECAHLTIANVIHAMLHGANLDVKFWPYAFHHYLQIKNSLPSKDQSKSLIMLVMGWIDDFSSFCTFGCHVWVHPPGCHQAKFWTHSRKGIF